MIAKFLNFEQQISPEEIKEDNFDISFGQSMMVHFSRQRNGTIIAKNAVDGYGINRQSEVFGVQLEIIE